jgi:DNA-binding NarL/FixJ family response regulator
MISVLIVDDQELMRESLKILIDANEAMRAVGLARDGQEAIRMVRDLRPDVVLMDIRMPELNGIECTRAIKEFAPETKVIILTTFNDDDYIFNAIKAGADGFLLKGVSKSELFSSILTVHEGCSAIDPQSAKKIFKLVGRLASPAASSDRISSTPEEGELSAIELRIVQLIGKGCSNKEIMSILNLAEGTVRNYISNVLRKLEMKNRTQLAIFAIQSGMMLRDY